MEILIAAVAAYLIGSVSFAVIVSAAMGLADPRSYGSKNPGATNVLRSGNKAAAILTLVGDAFKGWLAVWLAAHVGRRYGFDDGAVAVAALAVFLGHLYPIFFKFKGGKGVATAAGVLLALNPVLGVATLLTWLIIAFFFRYSSLAALAAAVFAPLFDLFLFGPNVMAWAVFGMSALLVWRHRTNIAKLIAGEESRIGQKKADAAARAKHDQSAGHARKH
ncbi:MAG TPA: glycerol-3-phosphate 1-O-acyltransferase PlsY [Trinickia sp.]|jgi:glycerol-3-phosphate acyltransferase PlsY|uniref:glycerol-3-phosphate 1-O-acyltransferase PlsY n=1 Tax=Trinickia sp. TaxID=2571163 RepID=UPI002B6FA8DE|nr:glycerol-3-phosphate 1-O-acyltransferase PlsY [Trinickia sp.]HTI17773.1 glycerol-3-phosphate 1-O-acyltransferase PlsY [Trinickia sp.]